MTNEKYNSCKGSSWPNYQDLLKTVTPINHELTEEFKTYFENFINCSNLDSKLNSFKNEIYSDTRSWHNWLRTEWLYRRELNSLIHLCHSLKEYNNTKLKTLVMTIDPTLAYSCYLKLNSNLNNMSVDQFKQETVELNNYHIELAKSNPNIKLISADILYQPTLSRDFYNSVINWFNLEDLYDKANYVHQLWYQCHKRAEQEFVNDIAKFYKY